MATRGVLPFIAFSLASSATYALNDLRDIERDRLHPQKSKRPLPAGEMSKIEGFVLMVFLLLGAFFAGTQVSNRFLLFVGLYVLFSGLYSLVLKNWPIVDVFCISLGFILRLYAGGEAFGIYIPDWLFLTVFLLALFLSFGKRCAEQVSLGPLAGKHRLILEAYPEGFLDKAMFLCGGSVIVTYAIYALQHPYMVYTVPLCTFGLLRYLFRIKAGHSGDPTHALLRDLPLFFTSVAWVAMVAWSVYQ